jgi:predicted methyltransferase
MKLTTAAEDISGKTDIELCEKDVERIIASVRATDDLWKIADYSDVAIPALFEALKYLENEGLLKFEDKKVLLTDKGSNIAGNLHPVEDLSCMQCDGRGISFDRFSELAKTFREIQKNRPAPSHDFDQGYVTPDTTISRFVLAYERGDVQGKDILILGDDDLVSIVLGLSGLPSSITVVEIDKRLTDFIRQVGDSNDFNVSVQDFDLRKPLPKPYTGRFDTFFTDPPETIRAADAFIGRGVNSLKKPGCSGYFGFTRREASLRKWFDLQRLLLNYNVVITDIIHNFSEYMNWGYEEETRAWDLAPVKTMPEQNWYRSSIYRIQAINGFKGSSIDYGQDNIYEDSESSTT